MSLSVSRLIIIFKLKKVTYFSNIFDDSNYINFCLFWFCFGFWICISALLACVSVHHICAWTCGGQKRSVDPPQVELQVAVSHVLWSEPWSSGKTTSILIQWAISPAPKESLWTAYSYPTTHWCSIHGHTPNIRHLILCWTICFTVCVSSLIFLHALTNLLLIFDFFWRGVGVFVFLSLENFSQAPLQGCCLRSLPSAPPLKPWNITVTTILMFFTY